MTDAILPLTILIPLFGAMICFVSHHRVSVAVGLLTSALTLGAVLALISFVRGVGVLEYAVGNWPAPLGIQLRVDGLSLIFMLMTAVVGLVVSVYASGYFGEHDAQEEKRGAEMFWPIWMFLWAAMNALYVSADLFNLYVLLEIIGLAAVGLLTLTGRRLVLMAGMRYLLSAMAGSLMYLLGVVLLYAAHDALDIQLLGAVVEPGKTAIAAMGLMLVGLLLKSAVFPLHFWLPPAHSSATAPVSALLSAVVVKASFYLIVRLWFHVFPGIATPMAGTLMGMLGTGAILWGSIQALRQSRIKMMIAYSTVAQLGYLFFIFPVSTVSDPALSTAMTPWLLDAGRGCIYQVLAHAFAKTALFMSAGVVLHAAGSDHIDHMRGLAARLPITVFAMAIAGVSLMGLPPSGGFIAKWLTTSAAISAGQWWWAPFIVGGGLLTAGYMFMILRYAFAPADPQTSLHAVPRSIELCALFMALLSIAIGLRAVDLFDILMIGSPFAGPALFNAGGLL